MLELNVMDYICYKSRGKSIYYLFINAQNLGLHDVKWNTIELFTQGESVRKARQKYSLTHHLSMCKPAKCQERLRENQYLGSMPNVYLSNCFIR